MKKTVVLVVVLVLALAAGAWAADLWNGITYFEKESVKMEPAAAVEQEQYVEGASTGGLRPELMPFNGITYFGAAAPAPVIHETVSAAPINNGITLFE